VHVARPYSTAVCNKNVHVNECAEYEASVSVAYICRFIGCSFTCMMVLKVMASMGQSSDEHFKKPPPPPPPAPVEKAPLPWPKGKPPPPVKWTPPLPYMDPNGKPPPPLLPCFVPEGKRPPVLHAPTGYCVFVPGHVVFLPGPPPPKPPPAVAKQQPPQQPAVAYAAAAAAAASEEQADAGNADEAATCEEQTSSVKAPPFKKPPPPPPPFAQLPRWAQLNTIRCQCSCGLLRRDACEKRVCLPRRLCAECMDIAYIRTNMGAVCRCRCRECK
jgi:hypothetical protein